MGADTAGLHDSTSTSRLMLEHLLEEDDVNRDGACLCVHLSAFCVVRLLQNDAHAFPHICFAFNVRCPLQTSVWASSRAKHVVASVRTHTNTHLNTRTHTHTHTRAHARSTWTGPSSRSPRPSIPRLSLDPLVGLASASDGVLVPSGGLRERLCKLMETQLFSVSVTRRTSTYNFAWN